MRAARSKRWVRAVCAAAVVLAFGPAVDAAPSRETTGDWSQLARRIASAQESARVDVTLGAEPRGLTLPFTARPRLSLLGSSVARYGRDAHPTRFRLYYAPSSATGAAVDAFGAVLASAGYARGETENAISAGFANAVDGRRRWCPRGSRNPPLDARVRTIDGVPALDLIVYVGDQWIGVCRPSPVRPGPLGPPVPRIRDVPRMTIHAQAFTASPSYVDSSAVIRSELSGADVVATIAARFTARGWRAARALAVGTATVQRFTAGDGAHHRWKALLVVDRRNDGAYAAAIDAVTEPAGSTR